MKREEVLYRAKEKINILHAIKLRKGIWNGIGMAF
jgi:hypothetical protein